MNNVLIAFLLTTIAGLSTTLGSGIAFFVKKKNTNFLSVCLGLSAGVMIYVSFMELMPLAQDYIVNLYNENIATIITFTSFFLGMAIMLLINKVIPDEKSLSQLSTNSNYNEDKLFRTGVVSAIAIAVHNFPEGLATFVSALNDPLLALPVVVAIAIHNIPEGISVSMPIYYATNSKKKAFFYSFLSGVTEPLGAILGYLILAPIMNDLINGILFAVISGIMVFISFDELLPSAREFGKDKSSIYGLALGMFLMAVSLWLFKF